MIQARFARSHFMIRFLYCGSLNGPRILAEEQVYFALRYYGREMIVFSNKLKKREGEDELVLAFGPGFGFVENGVLSA